MIIETITFITIQERWFLFLLYFIKNTSMLPTSAIYHTAPKEDFWSPDEKTYCPTSIFGNIFLFLLLIPAVIGEFPSHQ